LYNWVFLSNEVDISDSILILIKSWLTQINNKLGEKQGWLRKQTVELLCPQKLINEVLS
jgi:hypothetical protein